ncbi:hypothetical protein OG871_09870 [Kitasatospora sp. NBC_00374]|uniref:hypothetical protein n=1 Tax=Kitasatospora sp. NBC_00374 TaxID=2975964 RepID=UPI0032504B15
MTLRGRPADPAPHRVAAYLRCYPHDPWRMEPHRIALQQYADRLGLPDPEVFLDNGLPSGGPLPRLEHLLELVAAGVYRALLLPGGFVLSLDDDRAGSLRRQIAGHGCEVLELPSRARPRTPLPA